MELSSTFRLLLRRWLVLLIGIVATSAAGAYVFNTTPPSYVSGARMLLLLPNNARGPDAIGSPFLYLPSGLDVMARLLSGSVVTRDFQEAKAAAGLSAAVVVTVDNRSPMLNITVTGSDTDDVIATRDWVVDRLQKDLLQIQVEEGAPREQIAHGRVFGAENVPRPSGRTWLRPVLVVAAVGAVATLLAAVAIDFLLQRRKLRRATTPTPPPESSQDTPSEADEGESPPSAPS